MRSKLVVVAAFSLVLASCQDRPIDEPSLLGVEVSFARIAQALLGSGGQERHA